MYGSDKAFVHNYSIRQGHMAQVLAQKLETCLAGLEADSGSLESHVYHFPFELQVTKLEPCLWSVCSAELGIHSVERHPPPS